MSGGKSRRVSSAQKFMYWQEHLEPKGQNGLSQAEYYRQNDRRLRRWNY